MYSVYELPTADIEPARSHSTRFQHGDKSAFAFKPPSSIPPSRLKGRIPTAALILSMCAESAHFSAVESEVFLDIVSS